MADGDYVNRNVCKNGTVSVPSSKLAAAAVLADIKCSEVVVRCITNANQVSAATSSGNGTIYYRTQFCSINPSR